MDHQKLNILLIFGTFYFGGCGGQGCYFWPNPRVISKKSAIQDSQITFKPKLACIFLPARAKWNITVCVGTPCRRDTFLPKKEIFWFHPLSGIDFHKKSKYFELRREQEIAGERRRAQESARERRRAQESTGKRRRAQESAGEHRRAQESAEEHRKVQESSGEPWRAQDNAGNTGECRRTGK